MTINADTFFALIEQGEHKVHIGVFEVIGRLLDFVLMEHIAIGDAAQWTIGPNEIINAINTLDIRPDALGHR